MIKRCFIAVNLSELAKNQLARLITELKKTNFGPELKYVKPQNVHLTLHFLGQISDEQIEKVNNTLTANCAKYPITKLQSKSIGGFPNLNLARVVFWTVEDTKNTLAALQQDLAVDLIKLGIEVERRKWQPHLTLARINGRQRFNLENITVPDLKIEVKSIELMESKLEPGGARYKIISSFKLSGI